MTIFDEIDENHDGVITREEFSIALEKLRHLDLVKIKRSLSENDIAFNHKAAVFGRRVVVTDEFNSWQFIKSLPEYKFVCDQRPPIALPKKENNTPEYTLALDLDETLVHCTVDTPDVGDENPPDHTFDLNHRGTNLVIHAYLRPYLQEFLEAVHENFEVVIFTASQAPYANKMLDILDPDKKYFHHRIFREACLDLDGNLLKDLTVLGRDLSRTILVDNAPHNFGYHLDNGIPIVSWYDDRSDTELQKLEWFLRSIDGDVREMIRSKFQCYKLVEGADEECSAGKADSGRF